MNSLKTYESLLEKWTAYDLELNEKHYLIERKKEGLAKTVLEDMARIYTPVSKGSITRLVESAVVIPEYKQLNKIPVYEKQKPMSKLMRKYFKGYVKSVKDNPDMEDYSVREVALYGKLNDNGIRNFQKSMKVADRRHGKAEYLFIMCMFFRMTPFQALKLFHQCDDEEATELWMYRPEGAILVHMLETEDYRYERFVWLCCIYNVFHYLPISKTFAGTAYWQEVYAYAQAHLEAIEEMREDRRDRRERELFEKEYRGRKKLEDKFRGVRALMEDHLRLDPTRHYYGGYQFYVSDEQIEYINRNPKGYITMDDSLFQAISIIREDLSAEEICDIIADCQVYYGSVHITSKQIEDYIVKYYLPGYTLYSKDRLDPSQIVKKIQGKGKVLASLKGEVYVYDSDREKFLTCRPVPLRVSFDRIWAKTGETSEAPEIKTRKPPKPKKGPGDTEHFRYVNPNPRQTENRGDSFYRALAVYYNISWEEVARSVQHYYLGTGRTLTYCNAQHYGYATISKEDIRSFLETEYRIAEYPGHFEELGDYVSEGGQGQIIWYNEDDFTVITDDGVFEDIEDPASKHRLYNYVRTGFAEPPFTVFEDGIIESVDEFGQPHVYRFPTDTYTVEHVDGEGNGYRSAEPYYEEVFVEYDPFDDGQNDE